MEKKGVKRSIELTQIVPHVHLSAQRANFDDGLTQKVVRLPLELLLHAGLDVIVLVPHSHLDAVRGVVAFAVGTVADKSATATKHTFITTDDHNLWTKVRTD